MGDDVRQQSKQVSDIYTKPRLSSRLVLLETLPLEIDKYTKPRLSKPTMVRDAENSMPTENCTVGSEKEFLENWTKIQEKG